MSTNPFDEFQPAQPAASPFDEFQRAETAPRTVLKAVSSIKPDEMAEAERLAKRYPAPVDALYRNLSDVRVQEAVDKADERLRTSPKLAEAMSKTPRLAAVAHDDVEQLAELEMQVERTLAGTARDVTVTALKGAIGLPQALTGLASLVTGGYAGKAVEWLGVDFEEAQRILDQNYSPAQRQANAAVRESEGFFAALGAMLSNPSTIATTVGESLPQMVGGAAIGRTLLTMAPKLAPWLAAAFGEGIMGAGSAAEQFRSDDDEGLLSARTTFASLGSGAGTTLFGAVGGRAAQRLGLADIDTVLTQRGVPLGDAQRVQTAFITAIGKAGVSEGVFEELPQSVQEQLWQNWGNGRPLGEGVGRAAAMGLVAGLATGGGFQAVQSMADRIASGEMDNDRALRTQQALEATMKAAEASALRERSPEQFRQLLTQMADDGQVYVDAEVLQQLPADVLQQMQGVAEELPAALAANGTVAVKIADALTYLPGTPAAEVFLQNARSAPDAPSAAEAEAAGKKASEFLQQEAERVMQQAADQEAVRQEFEAVRADLAQQIAATGRYRPQVAETYAAGLAHFFAAYGQRTGMGTRGLYDAYRSRGFRIVGEPTTQGQSFEAALPGTISVEGYHFSNQARSSLSTAFFGTGLKGSARDEIMSSPDARLQRRLSFYFDKGTGIIPEAGVGGVAHRAQLTNVYDADADVLGLRGADARAFESALLDRGYAGYATRGEGTQPGQVVMLGDQVIEPEVIGPTTGIAPGERPPALERREADWTVLDTGEGAAARMERLQRNPSWAGYEMRLVDGRLEVRQLGDVFAQSRVKDMTPAVRKLLKNLTPTEQRKITDNTAAKIIAQLKKLPPAKEMAAVALGGKAKRGWYKQSAEAISAVFGPDGPRFAALLAATSPQCSVETNLLNALNIWKNWTAAGRPTDREAIIDVMGASVQGGRGRDSVLNAWISNSVRALTAENPADAETSRVFLSGPKVNSFFLNLIGVTDEVTNDAWMANYALVDQVMFSGSMNVLGTDPGKGTGYLAMAARTREAAAFLTKLTGETWTPAEVQETVWSWAKTLYELQVGDMTATRALNEGRMTDDLINSTPDFSSLFNDPAYGAILKEAGYGDRLDALRAGSERADDAVADEGPAAGAEAGAFAAEDQRRLQLQAARRLERLRAQRAAGVLEQGGLTDGRPEQTGDRAGRYSSGSLAPLEGAPTVAGAAGPDPRLVAVAEQYARDNGIRLRRQAAYAKVDPERAARIAAAYEAMPHAPNDPRVKEAYDDLARQTLAQYLALTRAGYTFTFMDPANDPYQGNPWNAMRDLRANQRMAVFPTEAGFGSSDLDVSNNPLLADTGLTWPDASGQPKRVLFNDMFRAVHDAFGHGLEGAGFRAQGEENAWQAHVRLFTGPAVGAITSETRGQNSWLNFGPYGEQNQTAKVEDTVFADQKTGLMPEWTWTEGRVDDEADTLQQTANNASGESAASLEAQSRLREERAGKQRVRVDRYGAVSPLNTVDGVDTRAREGEVILQRGVGRDEWTVLDNQAGKAGAARAVEAAKKWGRETLRQGQPDLFPGEFATKRSTVPTKRVISSKGDTAKGGNVNSAGQQITATKQGLQNFWDWFGNSTVTDDKDRPLVLYHSTNADTDTLRPGQKSSNNYGILGDVEVTRAGVFMTPNIDFSQEYLRDDAGQNVMPLYAKIENPLDLRSGLSQEDEAALEAAGLNTRYVLNIQNYWELFDNADDGSNEFVDGLKRAGYDGAIFREDSPSGDTAGGVTYVAFSPEQIKSAIGNDGTFDADDPSILSQQARGTFNPRTLELVLNPNTDLSTLWHEMGHFFLEVLTDVATQPNAPAEIAGDYATVLKWFGVTDDQWRAFSLDEKRKYHERWAESIEQYVMEGKVPNKELQPLMRRFAAWLKSVYGSIKQFLAARGAEGDTQLNDDIRRVMDRMLATDEQIAQANETAGLLPEETADDEAAARLRKRSMADLKWTVRARDKKIKELQKQAAGIRKQIEAEVTVEANELPAFAARDMLDKIRKENAAQPNDTELAIIADAFGFETVDAMLQSIAGAGSKRDYIDGRTEQRMLEEHGDLINEDAVRQAANEAVHNEARARSLATELRTQAEMLNTRADTGETNAKGAKITTNALVEAAKQFAANVVGRTPLRDLKNRAWQHTAAERRAGKAWQAATAAGKTEEAVKAKQDQVLNNAAAKAAMDAQAEVKKTLEFFARVTKGNNETVVEKGRDPDIVNAARAALALYGVQTPASKNAAAYLEALKRNDPDTWAVVEPMVAAASQNAQPLEALTVDELAGLREQIEGMWFLAKRSRQMEVDGDLLDIEDVATELGQRMQEIGVPLTLPGEAGALTEGEQRLRSIRFFGAALKRVEQWAEGMDGKYGGPFLRYVFQPIKGAADRYRKDRIVYRKKFQALVDKIAPSMRHELIEAPELGYTFGRGHNGIGTAELLHALLHTGNDSNKRKLLLGRGWAVEGPDGQLDTSKWDAFIARMVNEGKLTSAHYDFLQGVWDLMEETKPLAQKAHRDVFGRYFDEVTATPFVDPWGQARSGGYVPAQADPEIVPDATLRDLAERENESMAFSFPATNRGFTKGRVEYNRPLKLDLRTLPQHLDKVLLFSHMEPAVRGVSKLLRQKGVSQPLNKIDPTIYAGTLLPWLNRSAKQIVETPIVGDGKVARVLSVMRARAGASLMFANVSNTLQQITGLSSAAVKVKPAHLRRAAASYIASPKKFTQAVWAASSYMDDRAKNEVAMLNEQLQDILIKPTIYSRAQSWSMRHAYFLQTAFDNVLSPIVWTGAYNQAVEQGMSESDAIKFADGTVRQTQGTTLPEDVSRIETGPPYARLFTQFVGYFNMLANTNATALKQIAQETGLRKGAGKALYVVTMGLLMPLWVAEAIAQAFRGGPEDEDEDDDGYLDDWLAAVLGMGTIKGLLAGVPFVGQLAVAGMNRANDNPADDRVSLSPAVSVLEAGVGAPVSVYEAIVEEGSARKAIRDVASLVGIATGLPAVALARPLGYGAAVAEGDVEPTSGGDMARGLITGTPSPESR